MIDHGWWFYFERKDGKPLNYFQFMFWIIVSPIINITFALAIFLGVLVWMIAAFITYPVWGTWKHYKLYKEQYEADKRKVMEALKK